MQMVRVCCEASQEQRAGSFCWRTQQAGDLWVGFWQADETDRDADWLGCWSTPPRGGALNGWLALRHYRQRMRNAQPTKLRRRSSGKHKKHAASEPES
ncbi:aerotaxis receptor [Anopheles sinensis]|uniref:Aerotaxis receptor n=1 Tax=Anopheles sinensis TaxID=74873 RepID=A0A084VX84_ANOSI|nr:aerotaxis receptor [Anopheles sinensis]